MRPHIQRLHGQARGSLSGALWLAAAIAFLAAAAIALLIELAGAQATGGTPVTHTVVMEGTSFVPATLTVELGDSIEWINRDFFAHTATAADRFDSGIVPAGQSWIFTPRTQGAVRYVCTLHPTMKGALRVK